MTAGAGDRPGATGDSRPSWWLPSTWAVLRRPELWWVAVRQLLRLARPRWWRRWPPLPVPDPSYLRFRLQTAYGDEGRAPDAADVVAYLQWCRRFGRLRYPRRR